MPACDYCGKIAAVTENPNGRTVLRLCSLCQAEYELKQQDLLSLQPPPPRPWWQRFWSRLRGR
jgi:hypothetical protein